MSRWRLTLVREGMIAFASADDREGLAICYNRDGSIKTIGCDGTYLLTQRHSRKKHRALIAQFEDITHKARAAHTLLGGDPVFEIDV